MAKGEWLCFMDDDAIATTDYVKNITKHISLQKNKNKKIIICAHGTVLTLYFAYLKNKFKD